MKPAEPEEQHLKTMSGILFWCALVVVSSAYITTPMTAVFKDIFDVTPAMAVLPTSVFSLFYALGFLFFGPLSDRLGRKETLVVGFTALTIATLGTGLTEQFAAFVLFRGVQGFAAASFAPTALAYVFDVYPGHRIGAVVGLISFGYVASGVFGQVAAQWLEQTFDWHAVFYVFTIFYAICLLCVVVWLPRAANQVKSNHVIRQFMHGTEKVFTHKGLIKCYVITVLLLFTFIGMYTLLGDILEGPPFKLSEQHILLVRAAGLIGMICALFAGRLIHRFGRERMLQFGLIMSAAGLFMLGSVDGVMLLTVSSIVYVAGISLIFPAIMMLIGGYSAEVRGVANAWYAFLLFAGATVGPMFAVAMANVVTARWTVVILGVMLTFGCLIALTFKPSKRDIN